MTVYFLVALQIAAGGPPSLVTPSDFDLGTIRRPGRNLLTTRRDCEVADGEAIIVCGRREPETYPLDAWARRFATQPLLAETRLVGNVIGDVHAESAPLDRGAISQRIMVRVRTSF